MVAIYVLFQFVIRDWSDVGSANYWLVQKMKDFISVLTIIVAMQTPEKYRQKLTVFWCVVAGIFAYRAIKGLITNDGFLDWVGYSVATLMFIIFLSAITSREKK